MAEITEIRPQAKQETFLATSADIAIYGGAAGAGKSFSLLLEALRHVTTNPEFYAVYFRRNTTQIRNPGGLWDESAKLYPLAGGSPVQTILEWKWPKGGRVKMAHLEHEKTVYDWQGSQVPLLCCAVGTKIIMEDGSKKEIQDIKIGDKVLTLNGYKKVTLTGIPRTEKCVKICSSNGEEQINSSNHKILTIHGWVSYDDIAYESLPCLDMERPILRKPFHIFSQLSDKIPRFLKQYPVCFFWGLLHKLKSLKLYLDRQFLQVISVCKELLNQDNDCVLSIGYNSKTVRHILSRPQIKLAGLFLLLVDYVVSPFLFVCVWSYVIFLNILANFRSNYLFYIHQCDVLFDEVKGNNRDGVLQLTDVVVHIPKSLILDGKDIVREHTLHKLQYCHPYTFEERIAEEDVYLSTFSMCPVGYREVIDLTIEDECHYISEFGLVNKNCFDEITHFTESQFFYMLSRNRSMCGVKPYVRATCNPDADSWVAQFLDWWIDHNGFAIPERSGVIRWFVRVKGEMKWADSKEQCILEHGNHNLPIDSPGQVQPKSVTFISAKLEDNQALMQSDPGYMSNLLALDVVSQARLLDGNWKIKYDSGFEIFKEISLLGDDGLPVNPVMNCDYVYCTIDTAMKDGSKNDGTAAVYWARSKHFGYPLVILDWEFFQMEGSLLEFWLPSVFDRLNELATECCARHGSLGAFIEDKSSGTVLLQQSARRGLPAHSIDSKLTALGKSERAISVSGYVHRGNVKISHNAYNKVVNYKGSAKNYLLHNVTNFRVGVDNKQDDTTDAFTYGIAIGLGDSYGW